MLLVTSRPLAELAIAYCKFTDSSYQNKPLWDKTTPDRILFQSLCTTKHLASGNLLDCTESAVQKNKFNLIKNDETIY